MELDPRTILEHDARLRRLARALMHDAAAADDVVQRAWVVALSERAKIASPLAWLRRVVRNLVLERFRGEARQARRERAAAVPDHTPGTAELVERETLRRRVFEGVIALPEPFRRTLVLRYFEDLSPREISARENAPIDTIQSRLKRGRELLGERLAPPESNDRREFFRALAPIGAAAPLPSTAWLASTVGISVMSIKLKSAVYVAALALGVVALYQFTAPTTEVEPETARSAAAIETPPLVDPSAADPVIEQVARESVPAAAPAAEIAVAEEARLGSLAVTVLFDPEGAIAAGVEIDANFGTGSNGARASRRIRTDPQGRFELADLPAGYVMFTILTGGMDHVELAAGEHKQFELRVPAGARLTGIVRDGEGRPFPGAAIFLSSQLSAEGGIVTTTDRLGRFLVRNVSSLHYLGARADGFVPSPLQLVLGSAGAEHEFEFTLATTSSAVSGQVVAVDGSPIADATVVFDPENHAAGTSGYGQDEMHAIPQITTTDATGAFRFGGVPAGTFEIKARAHGFSFSSGTVVVPERGTTSVALRLEPAGRLVGTVRNASGQGLAKVRLSNASYALLESFSGSTNQAGEFVIDDVPVGERELLIESENHGTLKQAVFVAREQETRLDVVMTKGRVIRGVVVDEIGRPLRSVGVEAWPSDPGRMEMQTLRSDTGSDGTFELTAVPDGRWNLEFTVPPAYFFAAHVERNVKPDGPELRIVIAGDRLPTAHLRARVVNSKGEPIVGARVTIVEYSARGGPLLNSDQDGRIEFGPTVPGEYALMVGVDGFPQLSTPVHSLKAGENLDLGDLVVVEGQRVLVTLRRRPETADRGVNAEIQGLDRPSFSSVEFTGDQGRSAPLVPGRYRIEVTGTDIAATSAEFEIVSGSDSTLEIPLEPGRPREFVCARDGDSTERSIPFRVEDTGGRRVTSGSLWPSQQSDSLRARVSFALGRYVAIFEPSDGPPVRVEFEVTPNGAIEVAVPKK